MRLVEIEKWLASGADRCIRRKAWRKSWKVSEITIAANGKRYMKIDAINTYQMITSLEENAIDWEKVIYG